MQDRYAGDVGDYGKIGLLKCLEKHGFIIGVNWYRIAPLEIEKKKDGTYIHDDGKYLIPDNIKECDPALAEVLTKIAKNNRSVEAIQNEKLINRAVYYNDYLTVNERQKWHERALELFQNVNLVFMDPDNGLLVNSVGKRSARSVKYAFYEEVKDYIDAGKSVIVYNHRSRKPERQYFEEIEEKLEENVKVYRHVIQEITFSKGTTRDYFAIPACKEHYKMFHDVFAEMKKSRWGQLGVCRLVPEWADEIKIDYITYDEHVFLHIECEKFNDNISFEDYKQNVIRYLMLCSYNYSQEYATWLVEKYMNDIKESFKKKEPVANVAIDIGYMCG